MPLADPAFQRARRQTYDGSLTLPSTSSRGCSSAVALLWLQWVTPTAWKISSSRTAQAIAGASPIADLAIWYLIPPIPGYAGPHSLWSIGLRHLSSVPPFLPHLHAIFQLWTIHFYSTMVRYGGATISAKKCSSFPTSQRYPYQEVASACHNPAYQK